MTSIKFRALTHDDHKLFFEALGEYGKDFQNIQQYMTQKGNKSKAEQSNVNKSSDPQEKREQDKKEDDKKRDQIRNFYKIVYAKLSQLVGKLDDRVEKVNQELYLLINYGEIWKKHGFMFNNKTKKLLEDLIYQGSTTLRFKNKKVRLRTPPCKALKKINQIGADDKVKVVTTRELPKDVIVEFHPATNKDWLRVQSLSQNPKVRARLSIQKRLFNILDFLERKWNISQDKLNRTVEAWLKLDPKGQHSINVDDLILQRNQYTTASNAINNNNNSSSSNSNHNINDKQFGDLISSIKEDSSLNEIHQRLRLKPSSHHELKEVNITKVVPDNHLDLSLTAYIRRLCLTKPSSDTSSGSQPQASRGGSSNFDSTNEHAIADDQNYMTSNSKLPISLTTPDCSILFEKSCTSDQPSIAQTRKHLNLLQSLTGALDGCENSRMACDDTQDRSLHSILNHVNHNSNHGCTKTVSFATNNESCGDAASATSDLAATIANNATNTTNTATANVPTLLVNNNIPALIDEDAAMPSTSLKHNSANSNEHHNTEAGSSNQYPNSESQNSKSIDFNLPKNVTLGDYFKMANQNVVGGDGVIEADETANDAFPAEQTSMKAEEKSDEPNSGGDQCESPKDSPSDTQNHLVDINRLAEGWTRLDDASMTIGELYLAFRCPDKIILEYSFEMFTLGNSSPKRQDNSESTDMVSDKTCAPDDDRLVVQPIQDSLDEDALIFKLLTAARITLAQIECQKHEEQLKLHDQQQTCSKQKRRKINPVVQSHNQMTAHEVEARNQRVEEALKQLQPTRLCGYRRAR